MTGWWSVSYVILWIAFVVAVALLLGTMREVAVLRHGRVTPPRRERTDPNGPDLGTPIPDLTLPTANGHGSVAFRKSGGKQALLAFLTPTCEGCQLVVESLNSLTDEAHDLMEVRVILSGPDTAGRSFLRLFPLRAPVVFDQNYALSGEFGVHITPSGLLYDSDGILLRSGAIAEPEELAALVEGVGV